MTYCEMCFPYRVNEIEHLRNFEDLRYYKPLFINKFFSVTVETTTKEMRCYVQFTHDNGEVNGFAYYPRICPKCGSPINETCNKPLFR